MKTDVKLLVAGAVGEVGAGPTTAQFVMTSLDAVSEFTANDPYIPGGCVTAQSIKQWTVAVHDLKVKRPLSGYMMWMQKEGRAMVKEENPDKRDVWRDFEAGGREVARDVHKRQGNVERGLSFVQSDVLANKVRELFIENMPVL